MFQPSLERFTRGELNKLPDRFPYYDYGDFTDPEKINAVFPKDEWTAESPVLDVSERRDWQHIFAVDSTSGDRVEVYFERLPGGVAVAWARLVSHGQTLILREACYKDNSDVSSHLYSAGGIRIECTGPLRRWRIAINSIFGEEEVHLSPDDSERAQPKEVHVKMSARMTAMSHPFEIPKRCPPMMLIKMFEKYRGGYTTKVKESISKCCSEMQGFVQATTLYCEIILDGDRKELLMHGCRLKFLGKSDFLRNIRHFTGYAENGTVFHLMEVSPGCIDGYCFSPSFFDRLVCKGRTEQTIGNDETGSSLVLTFEAVTKSATYSHEMLLTVRDAAPVSTLSASPEDDWFIQDIEGELKRDKRPDIHKVYGVTFHLRGKYTLPPVKLQMCSILEANEETELNVQVVSTSEPCCRTPELTGGKGSSLAILTAIEQYLQDNTKYANQQSVAFTVPPAVVLTVEAYKVFVDLPEAKSAIDDLLEGVRTINSRSHLSALKEASEKCISALTRVNVPLTIEHLLVAKLVEVFGNGWENRRFAVRSSAVGEDSDEMSAAGQLDTFLGITGKRRVLEAIVRCWASLFALTSISYKHQYGQDLTSPMAVVIQEMVPAECAGVMFTCDPVTLRPARVTVTANFGLGESVASAIAEPDTYTLQWVPEKCEVKANATMPTVRLLHKVCGAKHRMVIETESGVGTEEKVVSGSDTQRFCLSDEQAILVATVGMKVMEFTDTPRDIEWAFVEGQLILLQSRPVTSIFRESDFDIQHDLNTALYTPREILSRANLEYAHTQTSFKGREVIPGVISPMSISVIHQIIFDISTKKFMDEVFPSAVDRSQYTYGCSLHIGKKSFVNFSGNGSKHFVESMNINTFGFDLSDNKALDQGIFHEKQGNPGTVRFLKLAWSATRNIELAVKKAREMADAAHIEVPEDNDSLSMLLSILRQIYKIKDSHRLLMNVTFPAAILNVTLLNTLKSSQGLDKVTPELIVTLIRLLRSDYEVESAQIPNDLTNLAISIRKDAKGDAFSEMSVEEALHWLQNDEGEAAKEFRCFRAKHRHRCHKEFDIYSKTWDMDPSPLVKTLQANVCADAVRKKEPEKMTVADLEKQPSFVQKRLLNFLIPRIQMLVYAREAMKSVVIKCIHQVRLAITRLGRQLQAEGKLPDAELVFFLTADELYRFIMTRNPRLLPRAIRRSQMHARLNKEKFPMLFCGMPKPAESDTAAVPDGAHSLSGTTVSEGVVVGIARVVQDLVTEEHLIQKGDILITRTTDIGWTPYFSLLSGVVTEVGGLLSHGGVIAREYGLPAVVGVVGATAFFKSGEIITLDGNKGVVAKHNQHIHDNEAPVDAYSGGCTSSKGEDGIIALPLITN